MLFTKNYNIEITCPGFIKINSICKIFLSNKIKQQVVALHFLKGIYTVCMREVPPPFSPPQLNLLQTLFKTHLSVLAYLRPLKGPSGGPRNGHIFKKNVKTLNSRTLYVKEEETLQNLNSWSTQYINIYIMPHTTQIGQQNYTAPYTLHRRRRSNLNDNTGTTL